MELISREELRVALESDEPIKLVMTLGDFGYRAKHIPGSLQLKTFKDAESMLDKDDQIVIYCSDELCAASQMAYYTLARAGYNKVRRYAGGVADWEDAGYPLEGELV